MLAAKRNSLTPADGARHFSQSSGNRSHSSDCWNTWQSQTPGEAPGVSNRVGSLTQESGCREEAYGGISTGMEVFHEFLPSTTIIVPWQDRQVPGS